MMFLDPKKPIATCESESCEDCAVRNRIHCHFLLKDLIQFMFVALPPFLLGGAGIVNVNAWLLIPWGIFVFSFFGFIEIRVMCSHCPHYAESLSSLKCWANYGSPKPWKYRPGPMTTAEKVVFLGGFTVIWGYPLVFLILGIQLFLLAIYMLTTIGFFLTLRNFLCSQCMNFACPLNCVDEAVRDLFFARNPVVSKAWGRTGDKETA